MKRSAGLLLRLTSLGCLLLMTRCSQTGTDSSGAGGATGSGRAPRPPEARRAPGAPPLRAVRPAPVATWALSAAAAAPAACVARVERRSLEPAARPVALAARQGPAARRIEHQRHRSRPRRFLLGGYPERKYRAFGDQLSVWPGRGRLPVGRDLGHDRLHQQQGDGREGHDRAAIHDQHQRARRRRHALLHRRHPRRRRARRTRADPTTPGTWAANSSTTASGTPTRFTSLRRCPTRPTSTSRTRSPTSRTGARRKPATRFDTTRASRSSVAATSPSRFMTRTAGRWPTAEPVENQATCDTTASRTIDMSGVSPAPVNFAQPRTVSLGDTTLLSSQWLWIDVTSVTSP